MRYLLDKYPVDSVRYFLLINDPDKKILIFHGMILLIHIIQSY